MGTVISYKEYFGHLEHLLNTAPSEAALLESIVNGPFYDKFHTTNLDLGIISLLMVDAATNTVEPAAHSRTQSAQNAVKATPPQLINAGIPLNSRSNIIVKTITGNKHHKTSDWTQLFTPVFNNKESQFIQSESGMACTYVYPVSARDSGVLAFSFYQPLDQIGSCHLTFMANYTRCVSDALSKDSV